MRSPLYKPLYKRLASPRVQSTHRSSLLCKSMIVHNLYTQTVMNHTTAYRLRARSRSVESPTAPLLKTPIARKHRSQPIFIDLTLLDDDPEGSCPATSAGRAHETQNAQASHTLQLGPVFSDLELDPRETPSRCGKAVNLTTQMNSILRAASCSDMNLGSEF